MVSCKHNSFPVLSLSSSSPSPCRENTSLSSLFSFYECSIVGFIPPTKWPGSHAYPRQMLMGAVGCPEAWNLISGKVASSSKWHNLPWQEWRKHRRNMPARWKRWSSLPSTKEGRAVLCTSAVKSRYILSILRVVTLAGMHHSLRYLFDPSYVF